MKRFVLLNIFMACYAMAFSSPNIDSSLNKLKIVVENRNFYVQQKFREIHSLSQKMSDLRYKNDLHFRFHTDLSLYNEYKSFIYDSAFKYAIKVQQTAYQINSPDKIAISKINFGFILMSSGMFKEAFDTLKTFKIQDLSDSILVKYYTLKARTYFDLIGYDMNQYYDPKYVVLFNQNVDSAINICPKNSLSYISLMAFKSIVNNDLNQATLLLEELIKKQKTDLHPYAMASASLAYVFLNEGHTGKAMELLIEAIKADIKASTKETMASTKLAKILFEQGNLTEAHRYIKLALEDANYYDSNLRQRQISRIMPSIEDKEISYIANQKERLFLYSITITFLSILIIIFLVITHKHLKELKLAKKRILESNKIKDEYIGYFFNVISDYIEKIEKFKYAIDRKIITKRLDDIEVIIKNIDPRKEREELYERFDKVFLKLFPDFVERFNALFKEEYQIILKQNQILTTDLRIFALIRLGITDNEKIAKILNYSVHTIYAYKTKIKNKALIPNEQFEEKIMKIEAIKS